MGYKDRTWCVSTDCRMFNTCDRALTDAVKEAAIKWWGNSSAPITQSDHVNVQHLDLVMKDCTIFPK